MHSFDTKRTLELIWVRASLNLRSEASVNYLSYAWWIIEPLMHMAVYYTVFAFLLNGGADNFVAFLLTGLIPWLWFSKTVSHAMNSVLNGKQLMNQLHIPKIIFPLTCITQDLVKQGIVFCILLLFLLFYGLSPSLNWFSLLPIIAIQFVFILGVSLICALLVPFIRDMSFVIPTGLQFLMFCSGIFFNYKDIPLAAQEYFFINPMAALLSSYRMVLIDGIAPSWALLSYVLGIGVILTLLSLWLYRKLEYILPRVVLE